eukprot:TRINITY_DN3_c0_g1_i1.p1 TRINITY_DN3_c0_g1~~TRINITY_DN3_c0_g1_i1.p1  ORF type:complete len:161 (-),score=43.16 TRINITY_DN3_c0_g1_i1:42-524(-)
MKCGVFAIVVFLLCFKSDAVTIEADGDGFVFYPTVETGAFMDLVWADDNEDSKLDVAFDWSFEIDDDTIADTEALEEIPEYSVAITSDDSFSFTIFGSELTFDEDPRAHFIYGEFNGLSFYHYFEHEDVNYKLTVQGFIWNIQTMVVQGSIVASGYLTAN